jgi:peptidoglycan/xylan/chitin deacetylase (PgdA/CDA1 family)
VSRARDNAYAALRYLSSPWRATTGVGIPRLRILAYHDISQVEQFEAQMSHLADHYEVVVGPGFFSGATTRKPPVWITFDDGDPSIVDNAVGVLDEYGFSATAFICPSVVDTFEPYWWQVVLAASDGGVEVAGARLSPDEVSRLKKVPDEQRRRRVGEIREALAEQRVEPTRRQLTREDIDTWLSAGHSLGNHSWDHPILDQCSPEEQRRQIDLAHQWFLENGYGRPSWFAFPNGNRSLVSARYLADLGYKAALLFDHRLASVRQGMNLSRIRVNGTDTLDEFIPKVAGIHPAITRSRT